MLIDNIWNVTFKTDVWSEVKSQTLVVAALSTLSVAEHDPYTCNRVKGHVCVQY